MTNLLEQRRITLICSNMKKKVIAPLLGAVVLGLSAYAGYRTYDAYQGVDESDLLLANIEALATGESGSGGTCGTHYAYIDATIECAVCGAKVGFRGSEYSYQKEGGFSTYKEGREGIDTSCTPYHGMQTKINTVVTKKC